jgi:hypothetical protein
MKTLVAVLMCVALAGVAFAAEEKAPGAGGSGAGAPKSDNLVVYGTLSKMDGKSLTITPAPPKGEKKAAAQAPDVTLVCNDATKVLRMVPVKVGTEAPKGKPASEDAKFEDLKVGQFLRASYTKENVALRIGIIKDAAAAPAK